jgi:Fe2+ transport system protein FeoA
VSGEEPAFLRHLESLGLVPGSRIEVTDHSPFDHNLTVRVGSESNVLGLPITAKVDVEID